MEAWEVLDPMRFKIATPPTTKRDDNVNSEAKTLSHASANAGDLQVWWIPQVPGKPFTVNVGSPAAAIILLRVLADYDAFQFENRIKPDYCNAGGLRVFEDGEWVDWYDSEGRDIDEIAALLSEAGDSTSRSSTNAKVDAESAAVLP